MAKVFIIVAMAFCAHAIKVNTASRHSASSAATTSLQGATVDDLEHRISKDNYCKAQNILSRVILNTIGVAKPARLWGNREAIHSDYPMCSEFRNNPVNVCKANIQGFTPNCDTKGQNLNQLIQRYNNFSICTLEAAINQFFNTAHAGRFVTDAIVSNKNGALELSKKKGSDNTEMYKAVANIWKTLHPLFRAAEEALVSPKVQDIFYRRELVMETVFCAVSATADNPITQALKVDAADNSVILPVNLSQLLSDATGTFIEAYTPLGKLVDTILAQDGVLQQAIELSKVAYKEIIQTLAGVDHDPQIPGGLFQNLKTISPDDFMKTTSHSAVGSSMIQTASNHTAPSTFNLPRPGYHLDVRPDLDEKIEEDYRRRVQEREDEKHRRIMGPDNKKHLQPPAHVSDDGTSPMDSVIQALIPMQIYKVRGDRIDPVPDAEMVHKLVNDALLNVDDEIALGTLLIRPQEAIRILFGIFDLLLPNPQFELQLHGIGVTEVAKKFRGMVNEMEHQFNNFGHDFPFLSALQTSDRHDKPSFTFKEEEDGVEVEKQVDNYVDQKVFLPIKRSHLLKTKFGGLTDFRPIRILMATTALIFLL